MTNIFDGLCKQETLGDIECLTIEIIPKNKPQDIHTCTNAYFLPFRLLLTYLNSHGFWLIIPINPL